MDHSNQRLPVLLTAATAPHTHELSRATSPGGGPPESNMNGLEDPTKKARSRPRTYPYFKYLPYKVEDEAQRQQNLDEILKYLYTAVQSGDFNPGAVHWTRELRAWLSLKFDPTREQRAKLVKLYYELTLAPGVEAAVSERFASMFMVLTKRKHYLRPVKDVMLDWKPLYREIKVFVLPSESELVHSTSSKRNIKTLTKLCAFAQLYFDPLEIPAMLEEFLPHFTTSFTEGAFVVVGLMNLFLPTSPGPEDRTDLYPQHYLPTYFHLWSTVNRSRTFDVNFLDLLSRLARDWLPANYVSFSEFGILTSEQTSLIFTAILRLLEIPVGQATSSYSAVVDLSAGLGIMLDRDSRGHPVAHHIARVFTLLENLPDAARVRSGSPEENVLNTLPATFTPLLASLSPELYDVALHKIVDFVAEHVIHQARDAVAFICNALCKVNPEKALKRFIPLLIRSIRTEIDENGAASTRTTGSDVLPRDRGLVWNVSMLSMCVVHVGSEVLKYKQELIGIALYMQKKCKGIPTIHISNFIHHLLLNLTVTCTVDHALYEPSIIDRGIQVEQWGQRQDPKELTIKWHVPQRGEIEFAVELFTSQSENALEQLTNLTSENSRIKRDGSGKDWSDEVTRNIILLRLIISGISALFNNRIASSNKSADSDVDMADADDSGELLQQSDPDSVLDTSDEATIRRTFTYPTGYSLTDDDPLCIKLHDIRERIGQVLHNVHRFLVEKQEDDVSCFSPLYTAYRSWFVDVGIERSAHVLDRVTKLLSADAYPYKMSGVRKDYPRPLLVRRANVYHWQRLRHNAAPRPRSKLDETLLLDLAESSVSLYTDIRRNAQAAGESALKAVWGSRLLIIPPLIQALQTAIKQNDHPRIKGALYSLLYSSLAKTLGRHWKYTPSLIRLFIEASAVDKPSVQKVCNSALYQIIEYGRDTDRMAILDKDIIGSIAPAESVDDLIAKKKKASKRSAF
ncbi:hypothetical protein CISG_01244 [Coccidioides immitis RMSCC 3703]|uniref:Proteasome activator Blm10 mid region domain-containing protein n=1 Tax=Coccidioides immitis RMSCC 3703 TaxID=454286 RepID=A0A0J8QVL4_COCIT|nr:hypothetical protein CISG_01244 [Coccidioides immitis RMSCC 3703]